MNAGTLHVFAHDVRHYLRTALTRVQLAQRNGLKTEPKFTTDELLNDSATALMEMDRLLAAFVACADASEQREFAEMPLKLVTRGVLLEAKPACQAAGATVTIRGEIPEVEVPICLRFVLRELIENAAKFRDPESLPTEIVIRFKLDEEYLEVAVQDNGIGLEPEYAEEIFLPLKRLHPRHIYPGFGLGLTTVKAYITAVEGSISVESEPGRGAMFRCRIPVSIPDPD